MKIFILSNIPDKADRLTDALGNYDVNVVSREMESDTESVENEVSKVIGRADSVVFVVRDPIKATMDLNKMSGISAAQCVSGRDIDSARKNGANVIVVGNGADADEIAEYLAAEKKQKFGLVMPKKPIVKVAQKPAPVQIVSKIVQQKAAAQKPEEEEEEGEEEEDYYGKGEAKGGFIGKLKHSLGIVDSKEQEDEEE